MKIKGLNLYKSIINRKLLAKIGLKTRSKMLQ